VALFPERRLRATSRRLRQARDDLAVADEQLAQLADESADAGIRAVVADDPSAGLDATEAERHRRAMARHRQDLLDTIAKLEAAQDDLLDQLSARRAGSA
jgi:hypothetical protein